jgi:hypothetical protein
MPPQELSMQESCCRLLSYVSQNSEVTLEVELANETETEKH